MRDWAEAIQELRHNHDLELLLELRGMARSTYYYHASNPKIDSYSSVRERIGEIYANNNKRYGYRRITMHLRNEGTLINHKTVQKLMGEMGLKAKRKRQKYRSYKGEIGKVAPNVLQRNFYASAPNMKWTTDVTEVKIKERKLYLSPILDMFNGEIISYTISGSPDLKMVTSMLDKAFKREYNLNGLIFHSDQGWHYQHLRYQKMLKDRGIIQSMSRKGNCLDNAMMENFFGLMKNELLYLREWDNVEQFKEELIKYIDYYNNDRIKLRLNGKSPVKYRALFQSKPAS